jgi:hypothetical protein
MNASFSTPQIQYCYGHDSRSDHTNMDTLGRAPGTHVITPSHLFPRR